MKNHQIRTIYWSLLEYEDWILHLAATADGLCYVGSANKPFEEMEEWVRKHLGSCTLVRDDQALMPYKDELAAFMAGKLDRFTGPCDLVGTDFQRSVWDALCKIPYGETRSYSEIADLIGKPAAVRAVGSAIGANPVLMSVPCHRVIGKNGALTGFRGGLDMKTKLLALEKSAAVSRNSKANCHV
ncbi:methylated-DNA--[protein]-cysteine S-methyltransferase [Paenibacillus sp.]|uniref:methylated-DNA--[protein]-cysteine S-methyltransferase n=1 Tax=Paenibacillus sp. TaxID=58172 RepID=UPI002832945D|nr:methylated-DNA--[protein]-cysteine S-methyltransferase [Paenibacillus sp.]MDR0271484.1 methylated-DNA--[protein]-cysteine S-methyltransferase [Paenibacillus sp.]